MAARERRQERRDVVAPVERQRRELEPDGPALGAFGERRHGVYGQRDVGCPVEEVGRFGRTEPQVGCPDLGQLAARPTSCQQQRRIGPADHDDAELLGGVFDEEPDPGVDVAVVDQVVVVEDQHHVIERIIDPVRDRRSDLIDRRIARSADQTIDIDAERCRIVASGPVERGRDMSPESDRVVVVGVEREPRSRGLATATPVGHEDRLSTAGRRTHQHHGPRGRCVETFSESWSLGERLWWTRDVELRRQHGAVVDCSVVGESVGLIGHGTSGTPTRHAFQGSTDPS